MTAAGPAFADEAARREEMLAAVSAVAQLLAGGRGVSADARVIIEPFSAQAPGEAIRDTLEARSSREAPVP